MAVTRIEEGGLGTDSFNLPVTLNGTDGSSTHAGDNIILDASASGVDAGERLLYEGIPPDSIDISNSISVLSGATLTVASGATIVNSGTATGFGSNEPTSADGQALGSTSAEWSDLYLADGGVVYFGNDQDVTLTHSADTSLTCNLMVAATTFEPTGDTASSDNAAIGYTSAEGLILTGQGSTNDVTIKNDADGDVISIPTGTTNVTIAGDLTISGDDLFMGTNTSAYILVADGTNYNPVAVSGDVTISNAGAITIASTAVEGSMLNNNIISGLTALTSGLATTDEVLISDAGTIKRMDVSLIADLSAADATALAIALG